MQVLLDGEQLGPSCFPDEGATIQAAGMSVVRRVLAEAISGGDLVTGAASGCAFGNSRVADMRYVHSVPAHHERTPGSYYAGVSSLADIEAAQNTRLFQFPPSKQVLAGGCLLGKQA